MTEFYMKVAGVTFEGRQAIVRKLKSGDFLEFVPDPYNPYDNHAVKILNQSGQQIGFIPREHNFQIFENLINKCGKYEVSVSSISGGGIDTSYGCNIHIVYKADINTYNDNSLSTDDEADVIKEDSLIDQYNQLHNNSFARADDYCELGKNFMGHDGHDPDYDKAAELLLIAARRDCHDAQNYLAALYYNGLGVPQNNTKARFWLEEAARHNNIKARENLKFMFNEKL